MGLGGVSSAAPCGLGPRDQPGDTPGREVAAESLQSSNRRPQSASPRSSGVTGLQRGVPSPTWPGGSLPTPRWRWGRGDSAFQEGRPGCLLLDSDVRGGPDPWSRRAAMLHRRGHCWPGSTIKSTLKPTILALHPTRPGLLQVLPSVPRLSGRFTCTPARAGVRRGILLPRTRQGALTGLGLVCSEILIPGPLTLGAGEDLGGFPVFLGCWNADPARRGQPCLGLERPPRTVGDAACRSEDPTWACGQHLRGHQVLGQEAGWQGRWGLSGRLTHADRGRPEGLQGPRWGPSSSHPCLKLGLWGRGGPQSPGAQSRLCGIARGQQR